MRKGRKLEARELCQREIGDKEKRSRGEGKRETAGRIIGRKRVRKGEEIGEGVRDKERLSMMRASFLGQVEGEKDPREASRHWIRRGASNKERAGPESPMLQR